VLVINFTVTQEGYQEGKDGDYLGNVYVVHASLGGEVHPLYRTVTYTVEDAFKEFAAKLQEVLR
jgi:hypothetical protein